MNLVGKSQTRRTNRTIQTYYVTVKQHTTCVHSNIILIRKKVLKIINFKIKMSYFIFK